MNKKFMSFVLAIVLSVGLGVNAFAGYSYSQYGQEFASYYSGSTSKKSVSLTILNSESADKVLQGNLTAVFGYYAGSLLSYQAAGGQFQLYDSYGARFSCNNDGGIWSVTSVNLRGSDLNELLKHPDMESFLKDMGFSPQSLSVTAMDEDGNILTTTTYGATGYYGTGTISKEEYEKLSEADKKKLKEYFEEKEYDEDGYHNTTTGKTITKAEYDKLSDEDKKKYAEHKKGAKYYQSKGMIEESAWGALSSKAQEALKTTFTHHEAGEKKAIKDLTSEEVSAGYEVATTKISGDLYSKLISTLASGVNFSASISIGSGVTGPSLTIFENGKSQITYTSDPATGGIRATSQTIYDEKGFQIGVQTATFELDSTENGAASGHWTCNYTSITYDKNGVRTDTSYQFYEWSSDPVATINSGRLLSDIPESVRYTKDGYYDKDGKMITKEEYEKLSKEDQKKYTFRAAGTVDEDKLKAYKDETGIEFAGQISAVTHYSANNSALYSYDYTTNQTTYFANNKASYVVNAQGTTVGLYSYTENGVMTAYFNANGTDSNGNKVGTTTIFDQWGRQLFTATGGLNDGSNPFKNQAERQKLINEYNDIIAGGKVDSAKFEYDSSKGMYVAKEGTGTRISSISLYTDQMFNKNSEAYAALTTNGFLDMKKIYLVTSGIDKLDSGSIDVSSADLMELLKQFGLDDVSLFGLSGYYDKDGNMITKEDYDKLSDEQKKNYTFKEDSKFVVSDDKNKREQMEYGNNAFATAIFTLISKISGKSISELEKSGDFSLKNGKLTLRDSGKSAKSIVKYINTAVQKGNLKLSSILNAIGVSHGSIDDSSAEAQMAALYVLAGMLDMLSVNTGFNTTGATSDSENDIQKALVNISNAATKVVEDAYTTYTDSYEKADGQAYINLAALASKVTKTAATAIASSVVKIARKAESVAVDKDDEYKTAAENYSTISTKSKYSVSEVKTAFAKRNGGSLAALNNAFGGALNMGLANFGYTGYDVLNMLNFSNGGATAVAQTSIAMSTWDEDNIPGIDGVDGSVDMDDVQVHHVTKTNGSVTSSSSGSHIQYSVQDRTTSANTKVKAAAGMTFTNTILLGGAQAYSTTHNVVTDIYEETNITVQSSSESDPAVEGDVITDPEKIEEMKTNLAEALGIDPEQISYENGVLTVTNDDGSTSNYVAVDAASINVMDGTNFHAVEGETVLVQINTKDKNGNITSGVSEQTIKDKVASGETRVMFMGNVGISGSSSSTVGDHCLLMTIDTSYNETSAGAGDGGVVFGQAAIDSVKAEIEMVSMVAAGKSDDEIRAAGYDPAKAKEAAEDPSNQWIKDNTNENIAKLAEKGYCFKWDDKNNKNVQQKLEDAWQLLF